MLTLTKPRQTETYTPDLRWNQRVVELRNFLAVSHRLPERTSMFVLQGAEHSLASWLHVQQVAYQRGNLNATRRNTLERVHPLALGLVAAPLVRPMPRIEVRTKTRSERVRASSKGRPPKPERRNADLTFPPIFPEKPRRGWLRPETKHDEIWLGSFERAVQALDGVPEHLLKTEPCKAAQKWVIYQRVGNRVHPFAPWRVELFEKTFPGVISSPLAVKKTWEQSLAELKAHIAMHGELPKTRSEASNARLRTWLRNQYRRSGAGTLSTEDRMKLDEVVGKLRIK